MVRRNFGVKVMFEMVEVVEENGRDDAASVGARLEEFARAVRIVLQIDEAERENPARGDHQCAVDGERREFTTKDDRCRHDAQRPHSLEENRSSLGRSRAFPGPEHEPRHIDRSFEQGRDERPMSGRSLRVVRIGESGVVVEVRDAIRAAAAKRERLDHGEQGVVDVGRKSKVPVDEVVRRGAVADEAEESDRNDGDRPRPKRRSDPEERDAREGARERENEAHARRAEKIGPEALQRRPKHMRMIQGSSLRPEPRDSESPPLASSAGRTDSGDTRPRGASNVGPGHPQAISAGAFCFVKRLVGPLCRFER